MPIKFPISYELTPDALDTGRHWLSLTVQNLGTEELSGLDVNINSLDVYSIDILGTGKYITSLDVNEERTIPFKVSANRTGSLYITLDGWKNGDLFHWESPAILITVGREAAELTRLFALTEPYAVIGEKIRCEGTVLGITESEGLSLEFWAEKPSGELEELAIIETKALSPAEEATYSAEIMPDEEGPYSIYAYLYDGVRRIGREVEYVYVKEV